MPTITEDGEPAGNSDAPDGKGVCFDMDSGTFKSTDATRTEAVITVEFEAAMADAAELRESGNMRFKEANYNEA